MFNKQYSSQERFFLLFFLAVSMLLEIIFINSSHSVIKFSNLLTGFIICFLIISLRHTLDSFNSLRTIFIL